ncbi:rubrerythrin family protein [Candidatus Pacearchaeota archaeon]|nr:rubrerythrin family protein [Candidatus Pacearchaeota archaeon]
MELKGSETEKNLLKSFAGESQARNRYTFFASKARKAGFEQIAAIFQETADNEKEHAEIFFKYLSPTRDDPTDPEGRNLEITATYPAGKIGTTEENLLASANGENEEWSELYPEFEKIARKEEFEDIANSYHEIAKVEEKHEKRFRKLLENVKNDEVFKKPEMVKWKCRNCGYIHEGNKAPHTCPACNHPQTYYEVLAENY